MGQGQGQGQGTREAGVRTSLPHMAPVAWGEEGAGDVGPSRCYRLAGAPY